MKAPQVQQMPALALRQPWAFMVMNGLKVIWPRPEGTEHRGRVWVYACDESLLAESVLECAGEEFGIPVTRGDLRFGVLLGTVEIIGCTEPSPGDFAWSLANPEPASKLRKPKRHRQSFGLFEPF